ncbi:glutathione-dependent formaldehyde-activating, GFA [Maricaulis maris MCS10]|uniref:Glutathione-dependent formaldehyde-activating, GFA n=1 Tax=Maricaulis maris (strain MCS10) TaxID=394221 RepID=Q0ASX3_MARMM|nr:GFA family protein [Maricaulis maris]ABI64614.1 glutathione-dependent formaldehyde-activating, GFA [Maricaulis maris MCS10]
MTQTQKTRNGGCRCGQLRFRLTEPALFTAACHCRGCQRMSGGAYSLTVAVPGARFAVTVGEPVIGGLHGDDIRHFHCPHCLSWVFTRPTGMDLVNIRTPMLDDPSGFMPFLETCTKDRLEGVTLTAPHSYEAFPPMEEFGDLLAAYAAGPGKAG